MLQGDNVDPELAALTSTAASTVVQLFASAAWERATGLAARAAGDEPQRGAAITMQATAFGSSRVNQPGRDLHVTTGE
ncbi:MAG: hypothetical protein ACRDRI_03825 [Pseudonocardiaceae bacterium]